MADKKRTRRFVGFTLVEIMAVIIILGLLMGLVAKKVVDKIDQAKVTTTMANLKSLHDAVVQFKMDTSRYPGEENGLMELLEEPTDVKGWQGPYIETTEIPKDAWHNDFIYELDPQDGVAFWIKSFGADGKEGGEKYDADLYSTSTFEH